MKKTASLLMMIILAVSCTTPGPVEEAPAPERDEEAYVRHEIKVVRGKHPYIPGMEPEGTFDDEPETIAEAIERLTKEGKLTPMEGPAEETVTVLPAAEPVPVPTEEADREEAVPPSPPLIEEVEPIIEECDEDLSGPDISGPVDEVVPDAVPEVPEDGSEGEPAWLTVLPETGDRAYQKGSSKDHPKLTTGIMLAESDAIRKMKESMWDLAVRESHKVLGPEGEPAERPMEYVPYRLKTERADTYVGKDGIVHVLVSADRASVIDWMLAASSVIIRDGWTDHEETLRSAFAELI